MIKKKVKKSVGHGKYTQNPPIQSSVSAGLYLASSEVTVSLVEVTECGSDSPSPSRSMRGQRRTVTTWIVGAS